MRRPEVLIVEDNNLQRDNLMNLAIAAGFDPVSVRDGHEALRWLTDHRPDAMVTDMHMPGMNGLDLVRCTRALPTMEKVPIMVVTGDFSRVLRAEFMEAGADEFILKPVSDVEFQIRLGRLLKQQEVAFKVSVARVQRDQALRRLDHENQELERLSQGLVAALEQTTTFTEDHAVSHNQRIVTLCVLLGQASGAEPDFIALLRRYAGLHDIGKLGIPGSIRQIERKLEPDEVAAYQVHTIFGAELLSAAGLPEAACNIARHHHERWDGAGYPGGLAGTEIPLEARIMAAADIFDALTHPRRWRDSKVLTLDNAIATCLSLGGTHLDPALASLFPGLREALLPLVQEDSPSS